MPAGKAQRSLLALTEPDIAWPEHAAIMHMPATKRYLWVMLPVPNTRARLLFGVARRLPWRAEVERLERSVGNSGRECMLVRQSRDGRGRRLDAGIIEQLAAMIDDQVLREGPGCPRASHPGDTQNHLTVLGASR